MRFLPWLPQAGLFNSGKMRVQEWLALCVLMFAYVADAITPTPKVACDKAAVELGLLALGLALSYAAGKLIPKPKNPFDDKPTSLAQRGSFLPRLIGRGRLGVIFAWAGGRRTRDEKMSGGKGGGLFGGTSQAVYVEDGWHQLCMGPAYALHRIYMNGQIIFDGPITPITHPSGATVDLGKEGSFRIFWGEFDQPINTFLGSLDDNGNVRVGISSRWPGVCYVEWRAKRLGTSAVWPIMEYEMEVRPQQTILTDTDAYLEPTEFVLDGPSHTLSSTQAGAAGSGYFRILTDVHSDFRPTMRIRLTGHSVMPNQDLTIRNAYPTIIETPIGFWPDGSIRYSYTTYTDVYPDSTVLAGTGGTLQTYSQSEDDGLNLAHIIAEMLFANEGYGMAFDQAKYDMTSLEALGTICESENLRGRIMAQDGATYQAMIAGLLQDIGCMLPVNPLTGKLTFVPIRLPGGDLPLISEALQVDLPEVEIRHGTRPVDQVIYSFSDRLNGYHDMTLGQMDDGQATYLELARARVNQIISTCNFETANVIAERRAMEDLAGGGQFVLTANRASRYLYPGQSILATGFEDVLRITSVQPLDALSGDVRLTCISDYYGALASTFVQNRGNTGTRLEPAAVDRQYIIVEVPEYLLGSGDGITLLVPRVRAHNTIIGTDLSISLDNSTYTPRGRDLTLMTGGVFIGSLSATGYFDDSSSPQVTVSIDASSALDLSADTPSWRAGRQLLVLEDTSGNQEICFLKKLSAVSGTTYTLDGILRARYDTQRLAITAGCRFFILQSDDGVPVQDVLLEPEVPIYAKSQPFGLGQVPLASVTPEAHYLYGKGIRPIPVCNLRMNAGDGSYLDGATVTVKWAYFSPRTAATGAGLQSAGTAVSEISPEGEFRVEFLTSLDVLVRTVIQATNTFTYSTAERTTDFGSDPASLKIRVTQLRGGYASDSVTRTFTKV